MATPKQPSEAIQNALREAIRERLAEMNARLEKEKPDARPYSAYPGNYEKTTTGWTAMVTFYGINSLPSVWTYTDRTNSWYCSHDWND